jgi:hypothetical protein
MPMIRTCASCGKPFRTYPSRVGDGKGRCCSVVCHGSGRRADITERFWSKVDTSAECWIWTAAKRRDGYGMFQSETARNEVAHRVAWRLTHGPIPDGMCICHHCDNPPCVRPDHLFLGTVADNNRDKTEKGRQSAGEKNAAARIGRAEALKIVEQRRLGATSAALSGEFGLCISQIRNIVRGNNWKMVAR